MINEAVKAEVQMQFSANVDGIWHSVDRQVKRAVIQQIMHECCNNQSKAAKVLGINRTSLRTYINQVFTAQERQQMGIKS